jgi:predicted peptidase
MTKYLNGFTIISFNHKNKYVTFKSENYFFDNTNFEEKSLKMLKLNNDESSTAKTNNSNKNEYWIIEDEFGNNKIKILTDTSIEPNNVKAGPLYDEKSALALLDYFNNLES